MFEASVTAILRALSTTSVSTLLIAGDLVADSPSGDGATCILLILPQPLREALHNALHVWVASGGTLVLLGAEAAFWQSRWLEQTFGAPWEVDKYCRESQRRCPHPLFSSASVKAQPHLLPGRQYSCKSVLMSKGVRVLCFVLVLCVSFRCFVQLYIN